MQQHTPPVPLSPKPKLSLGQRLRSALNGWRFYRQNKPGFKGTLLPALLSPNKLLSWPPPSFISPKPWQSLPHAKALQERLQHLQATYAINHWDALPCQAWWESITALDTLEQILQGCPQARERLQAVSLEQGIEQCLDVGAKNWAYVFALRALSDSFLLPQAEAKLAHWLGVELDGGRRYANGYSRAQYGQLMAQQVPPATYKQGCVLQVQPPTQGFQLVTCLFPFVFAETLLAWGLPASAFSPKTMAQHLLGLLAPGGVLLTVHLGKEEALQYHVYLQQALASSGSLGHSAVANSVSPKKEVFVVQQIGSLLPSFLPDAEPRWAHVVLAP